MRGMRDGKLHNMSLDPKTKQDKNKDGTSAEDEDDYELQVLEWKDNLKIQIERKRHVNKVKKKLYTILIDQSFRDMRSKIEGTTGHKQAEIDQYGIDLLAMIKKIICGVEESPQKKMVIVVAEKTLHTFWKNPHVANNDYKSQFDAYVTVLETYAGRIIITPALIDVNLRELYPSLSNLKNALSHLC